MATKFVILDPVRQRRGTRDYILNKPYARLVARLAPFRLAKAASLAGDWEGRASKIVQGEIFPALDRQIAAMRAVRAKAKPNAAAWSLPNGEAYYADAGKASTTTGAAGWNSRSRTNGWSPGGTAPRSRCRPI